MLDKLAFPVGTITNTLVELRVRVPKLPRMTQYFVKSFRHFLKPTNLAGDSEYIMALSWRPKVVGDFANLVTWDDLLWARVCIQGTVPTLFECSYLEYIEQWLPATADDLYLYCYTASEAGGTFGGQINLLPVAQKDLTRRFSGKEYQDKGSG